MKFFFVTISSLLLLSGTLLAKPEISKPKSSSEKGVPAEDSSKAETKTDSTQCPPEQKESQEEESSDKEKEECEDSEKEKEEDSDKEEEKEKDDKDDKKKDKDKEKKKEEDERPWFIGTLLQIFGQNIEPGRLLYETTLFANHVYGVYGANSSLIRDRNLHLYSAIISFESGITEEIDAALLLNPFFAHSSAGDSSNLGDTHLQIGFQISKDKKGTWFPDIRIIPAEGFPTGKYQDLDPNLKLSDVTGSGAFETSVTLVIEKIFYHIPNHPYNWNFNFTAIHHSRVPVHGVSIYGGGPETRGFVIPGERFIINLAYEFKFNENWGWGMDIHYDFQNSSSFHNRGGGDLFEGAPSTGIFSLAPEIEYNFSTDLAVSLGVWYSLFGRNSLPFFIGAFLFSYEF